MFNFEKIFSTEKPVIAMCHLLALPGDPQYNGIAGIEHIINYAKNEIEILQSNGVDGLLISNEFSYPYSQNISKLTVATMARVIGELKNFIKIPFGVDCMYDAFSTIDLAVATDAKFYRITLNPSDSYNYELGKSPLGDYLRYENANNSTCFINIEPSVRLSLKSKNIERLFNAILVQANPEVLCISSESMAYLTDKKIELYNQIKDKTKIICDGGCNKSNVQKIFKHANGVIIGTALKKDGNLQNSIEASRISDFIDCIHHI